jgi:hypothetical protein
MPGQTTRSGRHAVSRQIAGTGTDDPAHRSHPRCHQRAIGQFANPDCHVGVLVHQMHDAVREHEAHVDLRIVRQKIRNHRHHVQAPKSDRRGDHELAFGRGVFTCRGTLGFTNFFKNAPAGGHIGSAGFSQRKLSRRAM